MTHLRPLGRGAAELLAALMVAAAVGVLTLLVVNAPPFAQPSWLPESFRTALSAGFVVLAGWLLLRRATGRRALWLLGTAGPSFLASSHLGLLLNGTPHYLFGLGGDQINRVAYVTRFADSAGLADPFYADAAPFYPPQWFWVGGRLAAMFGVDGWEFYKPYAIITMAVAGAIAFVAWRWLLPARLAVLFGLVTAVVGVHTNAYEPYSWILICLFPQVVVATYVLSARIAVAAGSPTDSRPTWPLVVTIGVYLGIAALGYTLIAGFAALVVGLVVLLHAWWHRSERAVVRALLGRLAAMAGISAAIALLFWHRYLVAVITGAETEASVANDFAPESGANLPLPMFEMSVTGVLCLMGLVWIVVTVWPTGADRSAAALHARVSVGAHDEPRPDDDNDPAPSAWPLPSPGLALVFARSLAVITVAVFGWFLLSGLRAVAGSTLLPFRMIPALTLVLALAGVVGALALTRWAVAAVPGLPHSKVLAAVVVVAGLAAVQMVQHVSEEDAEFAAVARNTPGVPTDVLTAIDDMTSDREPSDLVLLTSDPTLYSYRPFFTFQAPAQAYATPAGRYEERTDEIRDWSTTRSAADLAAELDASEFRAPDVLVLNRETPERWVFPAVINQMPLQHNNSREEIVFGPDQFDDPGLFDVREVGARVVIVRR
ncbi:arabinofuranosyltransferase [uncultured Dietzia sp.]|uniref:arabinofuranosyltransferase n=1 Tax=uncultured Dietzia sp. TaxID=395519 RepID=UPI0025CDF324|nr:arabinofuranosyltransferase [uncultured Dietzia sp.]